MSYTSAGKSLLEYYKNNPPSYGEYSAKEYYGFKLEIDAIRLAEEAISVMKTKQKNTKDVYVAGQHGIFAYPDELNALIVFESYNITLVSQLPRNHIFKTAMSMAKGTDKFKSVYMEDMEDRARHFNKLTQKELEELLINAKKNAGRSGGKLRKSKKTYKKKTYKKTYKKHSKSRRH